MPNLARISAHPAGMRGSRSRHTNKSGMMWAARRAAQGSPGFSRWACERRHRGSSDKAREPSMRKRGSYGLEPGEAAVHRLVASCACKIAREKPHHHQCVTFDFQCALHRSPTGRRHFLVVRRCRSRRRSGVTQTSSSLFSAACPTASPLPAWRATKSHILRVRRTSSVGLPARSPPDSFFCSAEQLIWAEAAAQASQVEKMGISEYPECVTALSAYRATAALQPSR